MTPAFLILSAMELSLGLMFLGILYVGISKPMPCPPILDQEDLCDHEWVNVCSGYAKCKWCDAERERDCDDDSDRELTTSERGV